jgi:hypothetical protein
LFHLNFHPSSWLPPRKLPPPKLKLPPPKPQLLTFVSNPTKRQTRSLHPSSTHHLPNYYGYFHQFQLFSFLYQCW